MPSYSKEYILENTDQIKEYIVINSCENDAGCWIWQKSDNGAGYGQTKFGQKFTAHRLSYLCFVDDIDNEDVIRHLCHNSICCNPNHLDIGSHKDNWKDSEEKHRESAKKRRKTWHICGTVYNTCREAVEKTGISMSSIIKFTKEGIFDIDAYRASCKKIGQKPKI